MSRNIYNQIKSEYEKRKTAAFDKLNIRKKEVYSAIPLMEEIDSKLQFTGLKYNKSILAGNGPDTGAANELSTKMDELMVQKIRLLIESGYPSDYLENIYLCPKCRDTGYIAADNGSDRCSCYRQQVIDHFFTQSNLKLTSSENFAAFDETLYPEAVDKNKYGIDISPRENILMIKERCLEFIENFASPDESNLFFSGPAGVGKTFMSSCIALEILNSGRTVLYQTAPVLFDIISRHKMKAFKEEEFEDECYNNIFDVELLIIDDLGTEPQSAARYAELLTILNIRQTNNMTRPCKTIISTNLGAKALSEYYTERVASRIIGCFDRLMFTGEDIRRIKQTIFQGP